MKKLLLTTAVTLSLAGFAASAIADDHGREGKGPKGPHHGKMFDKMDANGDGTVTKEEARDFHEGRFDKMDANGDGKVTKDEAKARMKERHEKRKKDHDDDED